MKLTFVDAGVLIALHVAAATSVGAVELVTAEKPTRSIHRARAVKVVTIHPESR